MSFSTFMGNVRLSMVKHSPELLLIAGGASFAASIISAFKARPKYDKVLEEYKEKKKRRVEAEEKADKIEDETGEVVYTEDEKMADKIVDGAKFGLKMAVTFGRTLLFAAIGTACILGAFKILNGRYLGAVAVAAGANRKLKATEAAIAAELGEGELTRIKDKVIEEEHKEHYEEGKEGGIAPFAKWFDEFNPNFREGDPEANMNWLQEKQTLLNIRLQAKGHLFENEVWSELMIPKTVRGATYGILATNPDGTTNALDLGIFNFHNRLAVNGHNDVFLLEPNFEDEPIIERIGWKEV